MTNRSSFITFAGAALMAFTLLLPAAFAQAPAKPMAGNMGAMPAAKAGGMDMMAMMKEMNDKMAAMPMTGKPDIDFAMMMRVHHQGAIDMAGAELRDGKEPEMKKMAREIVAAQKKEIAQIDRFLARHGHKASK